MAEESSIAINRERDNRYAGFWSRATASACDVLVLMVAIGVIQHYMPSVMAGITNFTVTFLYYAISLSWSSRTLGQRLLKQTVFTSDGGRLAVGIAVKRAAWIMISYLLLGLPLLTILFTHRRQALHDMMAQTVVASMS